MGKIDVLPAGESALLLDFSSYQAQESRSATTSRIHRLVNILDQETNSPIRELTPSYTALLVEFDSETTNAADIEKHLRFCSEKIGEIQLPPRPSYEIPVAYGGAYGPDLGWVADYLRMSVSQVVELHCSVSFSVSFYGFRPGFAYLDGWPAANSLPRLDSPRPSVPKGSVALAGTQCGIYPSPSPGGWRLIGQTPLSVFVPGNQSFCRWELGATLRFYPVRP